MYLVRNRKRLSTSSTGTRKHIKKLAEENDVTRNAVTVMLKYALNKIEQSFDEEGNKK
ncbi:hypothetical protein LEA_16386 [human gut metagenome]|uniref:Uncharacterized protein n=1 Tax=human gut metagenome TaxID=408170 RepID=K1RY20_9ZZZZ